MERKVKIETVSLTCHPLARGSLMQTFPKPRTNVHFDTVRVVPESSRRFLYERNEWTLWDFGNYHYLGNTDWILWFLRMAHIGRSLNTRYRRWMQTPCSYEVYCLCQKELKVHQSWRFLHRFDFEHGGFARSIRIHQKYENALFDTRSKIWLALDFYEIQIFPIKVNQLLHLFFLDNFLNDLKTISKRKLSFSSQCTVGNDHWFAIKESVSACNSCGKNLKSNFILFATRV